MALIKIVNRGDTLRLLIPAGYLNADDEVVEIEVTAETRKSMVLLITAPKAILIRHDKAS